MVSIAFTVLGAPRTKKNHQRILRRPNGVPFIVQAKAHVGWERSAVLQLKAQLRGQVAFGGAVNLRALVYRERATGDLGNYLAAICDALEAAGVVVNDRLILGFDGSRLLKDAERPRVEILLTPLTSA